MQSNTDTSATRAPNAAVPAYRVEVHGLKVECDTVEQVVEVVRRLERMDREVPLPAPQRADTTTIPFAVNGANPVATAIYAMFRETPVWRRPVEIVKALKRKRISGAKYNSVYAVLRYGDFAKRNGRWNLKDAV